MFNIVMVLANHMDIIFTLLWLIADTDFIFILELFFGSIYKLFVSACGSGWGAVHLAGSADTDRQQSKEV